jgi:hypothetical protein
VIVAGTRTAAAFTLDICHPLPGLNHSSRFQAVPMVNAPSCVHKLSQYGCVREPDHRPLLRAGEPPDPPPPKSLT